MLPDKAQAIALPFWWDPHLDGRWAEKGEYNRIERLRLIDHPLETGMNRHEFSWQTPWLSSK